MDVMLPLPPDTNGNPEDEGCVCISADGKTVVVGSMGINPCVCVFYRTNDEWVLNTKIEPTNGLTGENIYGHCVVLSRDGKTIAFGGAVNKKERGFVSIYCLIESEWVKQTELNDFTHNVSGGFSESLAINFAGDILVVGSPCYSGAPGSVYVFSSQTGKWEIEAIFEPNSDGFINSFLGIPYL